MKVYVVTDQEMKSLIDQLELHAMREANVTHADVSSLQVQEMHRAFHFVAVRWAQAMGYTGIR